MSALGYVFGYGSLVLDGDRPAGEFVAELPGFARGWGVAMDNRVSLPGYKRYHDDAGEAPAVFVAFLDLTPAAAAARVLGVCRPVDAAALAALDNRERNYERVAVSGLIDAGDGLPVWTYLGTAAARARLGAGLATGTAIIHEGYLAAVRRGLRTLGEVRWAACAASLEPGGLPVRALHRRALPR